MSKTPTNTELARIMREQEKRLEKRLDKLEKRMDTYYEFMITEQARVGYVRNKEGGIDGWKLFKQILAVVVALLATATAAITLIEAVLT